MELADQLAFLNALLNASCTALLLVGYALIRGGHREAHRKVMSAALGVSVLFLCSYGARIALSGTHVYPADAPGRSIYLPMLASHVILAATVPFFALRGVYLALKDRTAEHRRLMRIGLPIWLYVSVTGVAVYGMLYSALGALPF